ATTVALGADARVPETADRELAIGPVSRREARTCEAFRIGLEQILLRPGRSAPKLRRRVVAGRGDRRGHEQRECDAAWFSHQDVEADLEVGLQNLRADRAIIADGTQIQRASLASTLRPRDEKNPAPMGETWMGRHGKKYR